VKTSCSSWNCFFRKFHQQVSISINRLSILQLSTTSRRSADVETVQIIWRPTKRSINKDRCRTSKHIFNSHDVFDYDVIYFNLTFYQTQYSNESKSQLSRYTFTDFQQTNERRPLERLTYILFPRGYLQHWEVLEIPGNPRAFPTPECKQTAWYIWFNSTTMETIIQHGIQASSIEWRQRRHTYRIQHRHHAYHTRLVCTI